MKFQAQISVAEIGHPSINHKYVEGILAVYEDKHTLYFVMEECKGDSLLQRIGEKQRYKEKDAAPIIKMILEALFCMHAPVGHFLERDVLSCVQVGEGPGQGACGHESSSWR